MKKITDKILMLAVFLSFFNFIYQAYSFSGETVVERLIKDKQELNALSSLNYIDEQFVANSKKLIKYKQEIKKIQDKLRVMNKEEETLKIKISNLDNNIQATSEKIDLTIGSVNKQKKAIEEIDQKIEDLEVKLVKQSEEIYVYIKLIEGNSHYNLVQMIISSKNLPDLLNQISILEMLEWQSRQVFQKLVQTKENITRQKNELKEEKDLLDSFLENLQEERNNLNSQKKLKKNILEVTNNDEKVFQQLLVNLNNEYTTTKKLLTDLDFSQVKMDSLVRKEFVTRAKELNEKNKTFDYIWPVNPRRGVSAYFRDESYRRVFGYQHDAIDLKVYQSTEIVAPNYGYVYKVVDNNLDYSYLILAHPGNVFTLYGHISEFIVEEGQLVEQGEVIALSGGMPGTNWAGIFTTGPHLHLEMYKNGRVVDPLLHLPLGNFPLEKISVKYLDRYKNIIKKIIQKKKLYLIGVEPQERSEYLLDRFANPDFKQIELWEEVGEEYKIEPYFLICVGLAETSLGNRLKTANNIGNVGNTDSGDVIVYNTPQEWLEAMGRVLNNSYLGDYQTLGELSRWGNKDQPIYASSSVNWFSNISKCLSGIYGENIDDDFQFRLQ